MSLRRSVNSSSSVRCTSDGSVSRMFLWSRPQHREQQGRSFYKIIRAYNVLDKRKTVTALKAGEDRAIFLGLGMMVCSIMIACLLGITMIQSHKESVWTEESKCTALEVRITDCKNCVSSCGSGCWKPSQYPCIQVYVNLSCSGKRVLLHHTEQSARFNSECFCATNCKKNHSEIEMLIASIIENITNFQSISFPCYYDPKGRQKNVLLTKLDVSNALFHSLFWPSCMFLGGTVIVVMVKVTQYLSLLSEQSQIKK
ncbi:calcium-activated potassium channel subunit beta-2 isoform X2 [Heptranchias perlo]|uniref:calcium-activated potassium channel subunit beta-2 isoform X2 n=1 Tax=Heptranchias perlo TaxID=212740 RepID=UPI003559B9ED